MPPLYVLAKTYVIDGVNGLNFSPSLDLVLGHVTLQSLPLKWGRRSLLWTSSGAWGEALGCTGLLPGTVPLGGTALGSWKNC